MDDAPASRLDREPPVFRGCSTSELFAIVGTSAVIFTPPCLAIGIAMNAWPLGMGAAAALTAISAFTVPGIYTSLRRGRPDGYFAQKMRLAAHKRGLPFPRCDYIHRSGVWDTNRE